MAKVIKEIIIMLIVCLIGLIATSVILYDYRLSKKVIPAVEEYSATDEVAELLTDNVDSKENEQVILTYEVTSKDLKDYEKTNDYVPGKANPFAATSSTQPQNTDGNTVNNNSGSNTNANTSSSSNVEKPENTTSNNSYFKDTGTK